MSSTSKIVLGVASGYLLGRTKKFKLAITVGSMLAGQRISTNPQALLAQGSKLLEGNPELQKLQDDIRGRLLESAKAAALATATSRLEAVTQSLQSARDTVPGEVLDESDEDEPEAEGEEEPEDEADEYEEPEDEAEDEEPERARSLRTRLRRSLRTRPTSTRRSPRTRTRQSPRTRPTSTRSLRTRPTSRGARGRG